MKEIFDSALTKNDKGFMFVVWIFLCVAWTVITTPIMKTIFMFFGPVWFQMVSTCLMGILGGIAIGLAIINSNSYKTWILKR